jgi:hypothetical protein
MVGFIGAAFVVANLAVIVVWSLETFDGRTNDTLAARYRKIWNKLW